MCADGGERDPSKLCKAALDEINIPPNKDSNVGAVREA
jgi:hypothetical protein